MTKEEKQRFREFCIINDMEVKEHIDGLLIHGSVRIDYDYVAVNTLIDSAVLDDMSIKQATGLLKASFAKAMINQFWNALKTPDEEVEDNEDVSE